MVIDLEKRVQDVTLIPSDINEHIPTIVRYGKECEHITEVGMRYMVSIWGWLYSKPKKLVAIDIENPSKWGRDINELIDTAEHHNVEFEFRQANILDIEIEETDLLFIDTWHSYKQLNQELKLHSHKVRKYICFHDTTSFETHDEPVTSYGLEGDPIKKGIWLAIEEFLSENPEWQLKERFRNNNGFTIIEKK